MKIIGIDPGIARCGIGIIQGNNKVEYYGLISTKSKEKTGKRLKTIFEEINKIIKEYQPDSAFIENLYFYKNKKTFVEVSEVIGIIYLALKINNVNIHTINNNTVKSIIGLASGTQKKEVQKRIASILHLKEIPKPDDTADALAIAYAGKETLK